MEDSIESLKKALETISFLGKTQGQEISVENIAFKAQMSGEQLQAYLNGEQNIPEDLAVKLLALYGIRRRIVTWVDEISFDDEDDEEKEEDEE